MPRIVFSDGSKQMAHNLDDLYERWMLKRSEMPPQMAAKKPAAYMEIFLPDIPESLTTNQGSALREQLVTKQALVQQNLAQAKLELTQGKYSKWEYDALRAPLALAVNRIRYQLIYLKQQFGIGKDTSFPDSIVVPRNVPPEEIADYDRRQQMRIAELLASGKDKELDTEYSQLRFGRRELEHERHAFQVEEVAAQVDFETETIRRQRKYINDLQSELAATQRHVIRLQERLIAILEGTDDALET